MRTGTLLLTIDQPFLRHNSDLFLTYFDVEYMGDDAAERARRVMFTTSALGAQTTMKKPRLQ